MKKPSGSALIVVVIVLVLIAIGGLGYYALRPKAADRAEVLSPTISISTSASSSTTPTPAPYLNKYFSFVVPEGWTSKIDDANPDYPHYTFSNQSGDYLSVDIINGGDSGPDAIWEYRLDGNNPKQVVITKEQPDCNPEGMCSKGDGKLQIGLASMLSGSPMTVDDKYFFINVGNKNNENEDRSKYREILKGLKLITK